MHETFRLNLYELEPPITYITVKESQQCNHLSFRSFETILGVSIGNEKQCQQNILNCLLS